MLWILNMTTFWRYWIFIKDAHLLTKIKTKMRIEEGSLTFLVMQKVERTETLSKLQIQLSLYTSLTRGTQNEPHQRSRLSLKTWPGIDGCWSHDKQNYIFYLDIESKGHSDLILKMVTLHVLMHTCTYKI